jgi:hypothetical protein
MAAKKGRCFIGWYLYSGFLFPIAFVHAIRLKPVPRTQLSLWIDRIGIGAFCVFAIAGIINGMLSAL